MDKFFQKSVFDPKIRRTLCRSRIFRKIVTRWNANKRWKWKICFNFRTYYNWYQIFGYKNRFLETTETNVYEVRGSFEVIWGHKLYLESENGQCSGQQHQNPFQSRSKQGIKVFLLLDIQIFTFWPSFEWWRIRSRFEMC